MTDVEDEIKEMDKILQITMDTTPEFLKGLLIPERFCDKFLWLIGSFESQAREGKKYFKLMMEGEAVRSQMQLDFITALCEKFTLDKIEVPKDGD